MSAYTSAGFKGGTVAGATTFSGVVTMSSDLDHNGSSVGFYGTAPTARPAAYTQTYSTASRTHAAIVAVAPASTAATNAVPYGFSQTQANAIRDACINLITDVANVKQVLNQLIDDLQANGLIQ